MPTISMFFGIIVRMYYAPSEHPPPPFHAYYGEFTAIVDIRSCEIIEGDLPWKADKAGSCLGCTPSGGAAGRLATSDEW